MGLEPSEIRKQVLQHQKRLTLEERDFQSFKVVQRFIHAVDSLITQTFEGLSIQTPFRVALYRPLPSEVNLLGLEDWLLGLGAELCYPRVTDRDTKRLEMVALPTAEGSPGDLAAEQSWVEGPYGIPEPHASFPSVDPSTLTWVFVPGLAFGEAGERIGRGAGYYDRYLTRSPQALRIALAFDFQLFEQLPQSPWDQSVHWILSESREVRTEWMKTRILK